MGKIIPEKFQGAEWAQCMPSMPYEGSAEDMLRLALKRLAEDVVAFGAFAFLIRYRCVPSPEEIADGVTEIIVTAQTEGFDEMYQEVLREEAERAEEHAADLRREQ